VTAGGKRPSLRPVIDGARLWRRHEDMARIGATGRGGVNRQALSAEDAAARALLLGWASQRGYAASTDSIGNLFIRRAGKSPLLLPILTGSHLDSQPTGGRYDGTYGVLAGLEALEAMDDCAIATQRSIELAVWTNEEGSRFPPTTMGSAVFAGALPLRIALETKDGVGVSVAEALAAIRMAHPILADRATPFLIAAYVEAHIGQGPILEQKAARIGAVSGIQGLRWFEIDIQGQAAHAGTTPKSSRRDAMMAAVDLVSDLRKRVDEFGEALRFTIGRMVVSPGSPNTVPEKVAFTIDLRHPDRTVLRTLTAEIRTACRNPIGGCTIALRETIDSPPVIFDHRIVQSIRLAATDRRLSCLDLVSGATHDAKHLATLCPTGMIFIPCRGGVSHNEAESIEPQDAAAGAQILADVLLELSNMSD
jgi:N-carbamoyl-L-amino-acid hydrolase